MLNAFLKGLAISPLVFLFACDNSLNVNDEWQDTSVVYAILDAKADTQWVRLQRGWLGQGDIDQSAQTGDSIYYSETFQVLLEELNASGAVNKSITLDYDNSSRQLNDGFFTSDGFHLYRTTESIVPDRNYRLRIIKNNGEAEVRGNAYVINGNHTITRPTAVQKIAWEPFRDYTVEFNTQENAKVFQTFITLNYKEINSQNPSAKPDTLKATVRLPLRTVNTLNSGQAVIVGYTTESLLQGFRQAIPLDPNVKRFVIDIDFEVLAGGEDLYTYMSVNEPATGIVTERPDFSNIENGYGLMSSRALNGRYEKEFSEQGLLQFILSDAMCDRNFGRVFNTPQGNDTCYCDSFGNCN